MNFILKKIFSKQARKPSGIIGRIFIKKLFNTGNADLNNFILELLNPKPENIILELGFGTGYLLNKLGAIVTEGKVDGIDFSEAMIASAGKLNKKHIKSGQMNLYKGDCINLPFENESYDKVCSANTIYFWKEPDKYLTEIKRVLKPGGQIVFGFRDDKQIRKMGVDENIFKIYTNEEIINLLKNSEFKNIEIKEKLGKPFKSYCALAYK